MTLRISDLQSNRDLDSIAILAMCLEAIGSCRCQKISMSKTFILATVVGGGLLSNQGLMDTSQHNYSLFYIYSIYIYIDYISLFQNRGRYV